MAVNTKNWQELKKPTSLELKDTGADKKRKATFVAEPLERGFGLTLGNALRRVLLSSLEGAAVTSLKVDGAAHEFATIEGVVEDMSEIILNLKRVKFMVHETREPQVLLLSVNKDGAVTAAELPPSNVQVSRTTCAALRTKTRPSVPMSAASSWLARSTKVTRPAQSSTTTERFSIAPVPSIAAVPFGIIGIPTRVPRTPGFVREKEAP